MNESKYIYNVLHTLYINKIQINAVLLKCILIKEFLKHGSQFQQKYYAA